MTTSPSRELEQDLQALSPRLRADVTFADELYCALCNCLWRHDDGTEWHATWRSAAGVVADLRDLGERYADFYYSRSHAEGTISTRVADAMRELGWHGTPRGSNAG